VFFFRFGEFSVLAASSKLSIRLAVGSTFQGLVPAFSDQGFPFSKNEKARQEAHRMKRVLSSGKTAIKKEFAETTWP